MSARWLDAIRTACEGAPGLEAALLFGSAARGAASPRDLDVALLWREDIAPLERLRRGLELASAIERALGEARIAVDPRDLRALPLPVQFRALREGIRAHVAIPRALVRFQSAVVTRALDELPSYRRMLEASAAEMARGRP